MVVIKQLKKKFFETTILAGKKEEIIANINSFELLLEKGILNILFEIQVEEYNRS